ncbi:PIN domain-containing protein [Consotaella aegiceratis]|uniref:PIN domain-containing protein n=1 Tax=Consotaella aegiceratis TaxID=3097961 RepID=UPI002F405094
MIDGADVFLDTNILIYAALGRDDEPEKFAVARRIVLEEDYCTSGQVLAEFYAIATRKGAPPLASDEALHWVRTLAKKPCQAVDDKIVLGGITIAQRYRISYWDGAIVAAAERLGAQIIYSEDLSHGQRYGAVQVINPFIEAD